MQKPLTFLASLGFVAALALPLAAQDEVTVDTVVATVNGTEITIGHMIVAKATLPQQYQQLPDDVLFKGILDQLVQQTALAQSNTSELPSRIQFQLQNEERSLTAGHVIENIMGEPVDDEILNAAYQEQYVAEGGETEYNASHILVETQEEALAIKSELDGGADFAATAREKSTGPSGPGGGSLGWFGPGAMVPEFEETVMELEAGAVSGPVQTQFGWHIVKLNETRVLDVPKFDDVREELELQIRQTKVQERIEGLTAEAEVDRISESDLDISIISRTELLE